MVITLQDNEFMMFLDCEPSELADPNARASFIAIRRDLEAAGVSPMNLLHFRSGAVMASITSLGPYLLPAAQIIIPTLGAILIAWVRAAPGRKVRLKIGDALIEANSVEEVERLIPQLKELQTKGSRKKPEA